MLIPNSVIVVTGGGSGIGRALCRRFAADGAKAVVVADLNAAAAQAVAAEIGGDAAAVDVAREDDLRRLVDDVTRRFGPIDLFCSNAGIAVDGGAEASDAAWRHSWDVNVMAHIFAARAVVPRMLERGRGYLLQTVSAAGLLTQIGSAPYAVTKHAALAFAEWLAMTYADRGIVVSALCPQGVKTPMLASAESGIQALLGAGALEPEEVAEAVVRGLEAERFLILPHPEIAEYFRRKAADYDRWLRGMRRLQDRVRGADA